MKIGIDASNIRGGGGETHLVELLKVANPAEHGVDKVFLWANSDILIKIKALPWLCKENDDLLESNLVQRLYWQRFRLPKQLREKGCDLLFVPGGLYLGTFHTFVTMSRTMLPFEWREILRYGVWNRIVRLLPQRFLQSISFKNADGLIYLSRYAKEVIENIVSKPHDKTIVIPHGVSDRFYRKPSNIQPIEAYDQTNKFRILYVSHIEHYKHQWHVINAVANLVEKGYPIVLDIVGRSGYAMKRFNLAISKHDPDSTVVCYHGIQPYTELHSIYHQADLFVFASSCENLPNTLLQAMASGLPIASSDRGPMPEVLGEACLYFDPENPIVIAKVISMFLDDHDLRREQAWAAYERAQSYSWEQCARETFSFLESVYLAD